MANVPHYPEQTPPQAAVFPLPTQEYSSGEGGFSVAFLERAGSSPLHVLSLLVLFGLAAHLAFLWFSKREGWKSQLGLVFWPFALVAIGATVHGWQEAARFFFVDGRLRELWYFLSLAVVGLSRPGQAMIERVLRLVALWLGGSRRVWWLVLALGLPVLSSFSGAVAVLPVGLAMIRKLVILGRSQLVLAVTAGVLLTGLSLGAAFGPASGFASLVLPWELWAFWRWKAVIALVVVVGVGYVLLFRKLRLEDRLAGRTRVIEFHGPSWLVVLSGIAMMAITLLRGHPGWLAMIVAAFYVLHRSVGIRFDFSHWRLVFVLGLGHVVWASVGRCQHWWTDLVAENMPPMVSVLVAGGWSALFGPLAAHSMTPSSLAVTTQLAAFAFGGVPILALGFRVALFDFLDYSWRRGLLACFGCSGLACLVLYFLVF